MEIVAFVLGNSVVITLLIQLGIFGTLSFLLFTELPE